MYLDFSIGYVWQEFVGQRVAVPSLSILGLSPSLERISLSDKQDRIGKSDVLAILVMTGSFRPEKSKKQATMEHLYTVEL